MQWDTVSTPTETSFSWIRQIPGSLIALDEKPLLGFSPSFPWKNFSTALEKSLQISDLSFKTEAWTWREQTELLSGMGEEVKGLKLSVAPLSGSIWWGMAYQEIIRMMHFLLDKETLSEQEVEQKPPELVDRLFVEAFYKFVAMEAVNALTGVDFDKELSPTLSQEEMVPSESCLCLDLAFSIKKDQVFHGRLFLSNAFRKSWAQRYLSPKTAADKFFHVGSALEALIHVQVGKTTLNQSEWRGVSIGDFLLLDSCSFDPIEKKGRALLVINDIPFLKGRIKEGNIKILEHPFYYEVETPMANTSENNKEPVDGPSFDDNELNEIEDNEDFDIGDDDLSEIEPPSASPTKEKKEEPAPMTAPLPDLNPESEQKNVKKPSLDEIPLNIVIEAGRIQMSIQKVLELQPGNILELGIHPEAGVDLVVNGKRIAKGEILRIGEVLGVRIIQFS